MRENKFKGQTSARKVVASVFWDCEGILFMEFLKRGAATNSERYVHTWRKLKKTILKSSAKQGEESNPYTSYSPELAPPDFHIFGPLKDTLWGRRLVDDEVLNTACMRNFDASAYSLMRSAYSVSCKGGKTMLIMKNSLWKNIPNFVNDVLMICINQLITVITVFWRTRRYYFL